MKALDTILQNWRFSKALPFIHNNSKILDIGAHKGELFEKVIAKLKYGVGYDTANTKIIENKNFKIYPTEFPSKDIENERFDTITMFAVWEHINPKIQKEMVVNFKKHLNNNGLVIITVPSSFVDKILVVLAFLKLIDTDDMSAHQHYGFEPKDVTPLFELNGFSLLKHKKFQLGLNNLFIFKYKK